MLAYPSCWLLVFVVLFVVFVFVVFAVLAGWVIELMEARIEVRPGRANCCRDR